MKQPFILFILLLTLMSCKKDQDIPEKIQDIRNTMWLTRDWKKGTGTTTAIAKFFNSNDLNSGTGNLWVSGEIDSDFRWWLDRTTLNIKYERNGDSLLLTGVWHMGDLYIATHHFTKMED